MVYHGHVVSGEGIQMDPSKTEAMKTWSILKKTNDIQMFLWFTGYYWHFIRKYTAIAMPLNDLLVGHSIHTKNKRKSKTKQTDPFTW